MINMKERIESEIVLPQGVNASLENKFVIVKGPKGELRRELSYPTVKISVEGAKLTLVCEKGTKREKRMILSFAAHIKNMVNGVQNPYIYKLKICSGHFPMNVSIAGNTLQVKNFLGEKTPRITKIKQGAKVKIEGDIITVESIDKEISGNIASDIELLTVKRGRDLRRFQDGIYIIEKAGKKVPS